MTSLNEDISGQLSDQVWIVDPFSAENAPSVPPQRPRRVWIKKFGTRWQHLYNASAQAEDRLAIRPSWTNTLLTDTQGSDSTGSQQQRTTVHI